MGNTTADTLETSQRLKPDMKDGPGDMVEERSEFLNLLNPALLYAGDVSRSFSKLIMLWLFAWIIGKSTILLVLDAHDDATSAGCILSMLRKRRDILRLERSRSWIPLLKFLVDSSACSIDVLHRISIAQCSLKKRFSYQVRIVNMRLRLVFDSFSRARSFEIVFSLSDHLTTSIARIGPSPFNVSRTCSSSEKMETLSVRMMMTCSIMIRERRERVASCLPERKESN